MAEEWLWKSAAELGRDIDAGRIDSRALTETYLEAIANNEFTARIFTSVAAERARAEADAADARAKAGLRRGPLDGVPISWKDLYDAEGLTTEAGSAFLKGQVAARDCALLARAGGAGLVFLGKTHLTELAFSGLGVNPITATPPNVHDPDLAPGGSSSGAAASVAYGLSAAAIGSDTGGSVRAPAAWNDLVGLKTTHGRLSMDGATALCPKLDTAGPLCRSVEDAALMWSVLSATPAPDLSGASVRGMRFRLATEGGAAHEDPVARAAIEAAASALRDAGASIDEASPPELDAALELAPKIYAPEAYATWAKEIDAHPEVMHPPVRDRFLGGRAISAAEYAAAWSRLDELRAAYLQRTVDVDAVLTVTTPIAPPRTDDLLADDAYFSERNVLTLRNTRIGNLLGLCALTLPTGAPSVGLMLSSAPDSEPRLLQIGAAVEQVLNG